MVYTWVEGSVNYQKTRDVRAFLGSCGGRIVSSCSSVCELRGADHVDEVRGFIQAFYPLIEVVESLRLDE